PNAAAPNDDVVLRRLAPLDFAHVNAERDFNPLRVARLELAVELFLLIGRADEKVGESEGEHETRPFGGEVDALTDRRCAAIQLAQFEDERIEKIVDGALTATALEESAGRLADEDVGACHRVAGTFVVPSVARKLSDRWRQNRASRAAKSLAHARDDIVCDERDVRDLRDLARKVRR